MYVCMYISFYLKHQQFFALHNERWIHPYGHSTVRSPAHTHILFLCHSWNSRNWKLGLLSRTYKLLFNVHKIFSQRPKNKNAGTHLFSFVWTQFPQKYGVMRWHTNCSPYMEHKNRYITQSMWMWMSKTTKNPKRKRDKDRDRDELRMNENSAEYGWLVLNSLSI